MTWDILSRSDIKHCVRLRPYLHKNILSRNIMQMTKHILEMLWVFLEYFRKTALPRGCFSSIFLKILRTVYLATLDGQLDPI